MSGHVHTSLDPNSSKRINTVEVCVTGIISVFKSMKIKIRLMILICRLDFLRKPSNSVDISIRRGITPKLILMTIIGPKYSPTNSTKNALPTNHPSTATFNGSRREMAYAGVKISIETRNKIKKRTDRLMMATVVLTLKLGQIMSLYR